MSHAPLLSMNAYGPLSDRRLIRGKRVAVVARPLAPSPSRPPRGLPAGETYQVFYGNDPSRIFDWAELRPTEYGTLAAVFDLPTSTPGGRFYYRLVGSKGTVVDNGGFPFSQQVVDSAVRLGVEGGRLLLRYSGPAAGPDSRLHAGWNGWKTVFDMGMASIDQGAAKYGSPGGFTSALLEVPSWATSIDFVVFHRDSCDNHGGRDWRFSLKPLVDASVREKSDGLQTVDISYAWGALEAPIVRYGINDWLELADQPLSPLPGRPGAWETSLRVNADAAVLRLCFHDGKGRWENDGGRNWEFDVR